MKTNSSEPYPSHQAFSLVEMIGVLAVIAIIASMVLPRLFDSIALAQVTTAASSVVTIKNAAMTYYGKYGRFGTETGAVITSTNDVAALDWGTQVLLRGGYIERAFKTPIAQTAVVRLRPIVSGASAPTASNTAYNLDGTDPAANDSGPGRWVVEAYLTGVSKMNAADLNLLIDGAASTLADDLTNQRDTQGRVKFDASDSTCDVQVYIAHR